MLQERDQSDGNGSIASSQGSASSNEGISSSKKLGVVVCEEVFDEHSQPTYEEILEYAEKIGINIKTEPHLLSIAKEGVLQQLPPQWKPCWDEALSDFYYFNIETGETQWCHPLDDLYRQKVILARQGEKQINKNLDDQATSDISGGDTSDILQEKDLTETSQALASENEMALPKPTKLAPLQPLGKPGSNTTMKKGLPPLRGGKPGNDLLSDLSSSSRSRPKISDELSPVPSPKRIGLNPTKQVESRIQNERSPAPKQKGLSLRLSGSSFMKSSEEREDSEISRKSQDHSPVKSILKINSPVKPATANARANLMAKDDKKIHFDLNESMRIETESEDSSSRDSPKIKSSQDIKRAANSLLLSQNKNLLENNILVKDPDELTANPKTSETDEFSTGVETPNRTRSPSPSRPELAPIQPRPTTRLSKILSKTASTESLREEDNNSRSSTKSAKNDSNSSSNKAKNKASKVPLHETIKSVEVDPVPAKAKDIPIIISKPVLVKPKSKQITNTPVMQPEESSSPGESSEEEIDVEVSPVKTKSNKNLGRNLSSTLASLGTNQRQHFQDDKESGLSDDASGRPDDVLQTVKFGDDVLQQMRAKRNEILSSNAAMSKSTDSKIVKMNHQDKYMSPTPRIVEPEPDRTEEKLFQMSQEFDEKLEHLQSEMTSLMAVNKNEIQSKVKEIVSSETGELRKEFKLERLEQESKFRSMVSEEMAVLRRSLDSDFDKQRQTLLAAFNEELSRALKSSERIKPVEPIEDRPQIDLRTELNHHRRQLDDELKRHLADSVVELKNELTMTLKEQEKELLKLMVKAKTGNEVSGGSKSMPFKSDFARELEEIEDDLRQLRTIVTTNDDIKPPAATDIRKDIDSDTSDDFIDVGRTRHRPKTRKKHHGSVAYLTSDVDSQYESSSGDVNVSLQNLQQRVNLLEKSLMPIQMPIGQYPVQSFHTKNHTATTPIGGFFETSGGQFSTTVAPTGGFNMSQFTRPSQSAWTVEDQIFKSKMWLKQRNQNALPRS